MGNESYLKKLHRELLEIMLEIDRICSANGLKYYLIGGTLLGAIRHKGFIPWDDDLDIVMPRDDFEKFVIITRSDLESKYELQWITTNAEYWQVFAKVCKKNTLFKESGLNNFKPTGIFVDIFPLDYSSSYSSILSFKKRCIVRINTLIWAKNNQGSGVKNTIRRTISRFFSIRFLQNCMIMIMKSSKKRGFDYYANYGSQYSIKKQTMPIEWYGEGKNLAFEGKLFKGPVEYSKVLTSIFGPCYMELPPEEKRRCHYPEKVIFSDGEEMIFEKPKHIVTINEQENY